MRVGWPVSLVNVYIISEDDMGSLSHATLLTDCDFGACRGNQQSFQQFSDFL